MCTKCKKNIAVVFITKVENGVTMNEGYCLKCARSLGIPQIDQAVQQMGFSEEDLDTLTDEMSSMFGQFDSGDHDEDDMDSQTATFPLLNQLFGGMANNQPAQPNNRPAPKKEEPQEEDQAVENTAYFQMRQRITELLSVLPEDAAKILTLRFGLEGGLPLSPEETGRKLGMTAQEVLAAESAALAKLRQEK